MNFESTSSIPNILRKSKKNNFTIIDNDMLRDSRLSWKARGLLCYLLHLPDDWKINFNHLQTQAPDGKDSLKSGINELRKFGYLNLEKIREKGKFTCFIWTIYEVPFIEKTASTDKREPLAEKPLMEKPLMENPPLLSTKEQPSTNKTNICASGADAFPSSFAKKKVKKNPDPSLTEEQHQKLIAKYGKELTDKAIYDLREWKESKAQVEPSALYKHSDYRRITKWVIPDLLKTPNPSSKKKSHKDTLATVFKSGEMYGNYYVNFDEWGANIQTQSGYTIFTSKYAEHGFLEQFENACRKSNIPFKR